VIVGKLLVDAFRESFCSVRRRRSNGYCIYHRNPGNENVMGKPRGTSQYLFICRANDLVLYISFLPFILRNISDTIVFKEINEYHSNISHRKWIFSQGIISLPLNHCGTKLLRQQDGPFMLSLSRQSFSPFLPPQFLKPFPAFSFLPLLPSLLTLHCSHKKMPPFST